MDAFDLDTFLSLPRLGGLTLSPHGERLIVAVSEPSPDGKSFRSSLWQLDPEDGAAPRRLTRSAKGESAAVFTPDGTLLFTSARPDPDASEPGTEPKAALWALPPTSGEAVLVAAPPGGIGAVRTAREAGTVVASAAIFPDVDDLEADAERAEARETAGVSAQLFTGFPIRYWDRWLGPRRAALWSGDLGGTAPDRVDLQLLARDDGPGLEDASFGLTPDGSTVVTTWARSTEPDVRRRVTDLVTIDVATGERRDLLADGYWYSSVAVSHDGQRVAAVREDVGTPDRPADVDLVIIDLETRTARTAASGLDLWPTSPRWLPSGNALVFEADEEGHHPLFRLDLDPNGGDRVTRLTADGAYSDVCVSSDGERLYALRATVARPPHPVALDPSTPDQTPTEIPFPLAEATGPGRVERVTAEADDGVSIGSWLVLPPGASASEPAPLVVFIHGGPLGSWNTWHWRWNPHVLAEQGYAVLCPDPALSTGYGQDFIARGWGEWGDRPYTDVLTAVDGAIARDDIDAERTAAMGGSFGGYLANWVAGHTDRFRAIVTHASLWHLEGFHGTTDLGPWWEHQFGDPYTDPRRYREHSPHRSVSEIHTPMLVIHGEKDYRVPISEALQLWTDLARHRVEAQFLYFPDENHWVLKPQNARLWYRTVLAFLDHHVRDEPWERPELL